MDFERKHVKDIKDEKDSADRKEPKDDKDHKDTKDRKDKEQFTESSRPELSALSSAILCKADATFGDWDIFI